MRVTKNTSKDTIAAAAPWREVVEPIAPAVTPTPATSEGVAPTVAPTDGTPAVQVATSPATVALTPSPAVVLATTRVQRGVPYNGTIHLTGKPFSARGARGRAWAAIVDGMGVAAWITTARTVGNGGCGVGDLTFLAGPRHSAIVIKDANGVQVYPMVEVAPTV